MRGRALIAGGALFLGACSGGEAAEAPSSILEREPVISTVSPEVAREALAQEAKDFHWRGIEAMSTQIMEGSAALNYLPGVCVSWRTKEGILAMRNPVFYEFKEGKQSVTIIPFTAAAVEGTIQVAEGLFAYTRHGELGTKETYYYPSDIQGDATVYDPTVVISESMKTSAMAQAQVSSGGINPGDLPGAYLVDETTGNHIMDAQAFVVTNAAETKQALSEFCGTDRFIPFLLGES